MFLTWIQWPPAVQLLLYLSQQAFLLAVSAAIFRLVIHTRPLRRLTWPVRSAALFGRPCLLTGSSVYQKTTQMLGWWCDKLQMKPSGTWQRV